MRLTRGEGTADESVVEVDYDLNGNRRRVLDAEDTDHDGQREATTFAYDGFDRLVQVVDALQDQVLVEHDVASQVVRQVVMGHPAGSPTGAPVLLSDARFDHDELGRVFQTHAALFLAGQLLAQRPVTLSDHDGDGLVTALLEHDALSRTWAVVEDDLQVSRTVFDGASRAVESIDALGNRQVVTHDRNGNPLAVTSVELVAVPGVAAESFTTRYVWDQLGRLARVSDNAGQTAYFTYDSRDQLVQRADPLGAAITDPLGVVPTGINAPGNTTRWLHDGLGRVLTETHDLRTGGQGGAPLDLSNPANPDGQVTLAYVWDQSSRLRAIVDDAGRTTTMGYDALDRKTTHTYADGSFAQFRFDLDDNVQSIRDPNGSVITRTHDALNRLVQVDVSRAPGVGGTTRETYAHDGLGRVVRMTDDNGGLAPSVVERTFDSLSRLVEERQDGKAISSTFTGDGKRTSVTYPGGRTIGYVHDALDRVQRITDGTGVGAGMIAEYGWTGPGHRPLFRRSGNGTALTMLDDLGQTDVGYDSVQRLTRLRHVGPSGQAFVDRAHGYDRASNRTFEQRLDDGGLTDRYAYDSTYRVTASFFDEAGPAGGDPAPGAVRRDLAASAYRYDGVGNRVEVTEDRLVTRPPTPGGGKAAIHARERVDLGEQSRVEGDVLVDETRDHGWCRFGHGSHRRGHGHGRGHDDDGRGRDERRHGRRRGQESNATLDYRAVVQGDVVAERVELKRQARVEGDVETDDLRRGQGSVVTGAVSAYATPDPAVADVARVNPGRTDFTSRLNQVVTLQPGRYDDVRILAGSRLILPGGTYELSTLHLGLGVVVEVRGPVLIRVASTLQLLHGTKVQPAAGLTTAQVRWETTDRNVLVGNDVQFFGELAAPEARVDVGRDARIRGAIEAERVVVGDCAQVIGPPSGPGSPGGVDRVQRQIAYGVNSLNQYTTVGGVARSHDRSGNLVDDGARRLTWDYRNRLVAVADKTSGRPIAAYAYDCGNRRVGKTTYTAAGGVDRVTRSFWDGWDLVEEQAATGATEVTYVSGVGIDEHLQVVRSSASPQGAGVLWCAQDARGDVVAVTNASGAIVERAKFDDFGRQTGGGAQPHGFQGRYRDAETGWIYFRNRHYDPETGRFLSRDPVWDPTNLGNLYAFCGNGAITGRDPLGLADLTLEAAEQAFNLRPNVDTAKDYVAALQRAGKSLPGEAGRVVKLLEERATLVRQHVVASSSFEEFTIDLIRQAPEVDGQRVVAPDWEARRLKAVDALDEVEKRLAKNTDSLEYSVSRLGKPGRRLLAQVAVRLTPRLATAASYAAGPATRIAFGTAVLLLGVAGNAYGLDSAAQQSPQAFAEEVGGLVGGAAGGLVGGVGGSVAGPKGAVGGAVVGGFVGDAAGRSVVGLMAAGLDEREADAQREKFGNLRFPGQTSTLWKGRGSSFTPETRGNQLDGIFDEEFAAPGCH
jgi:RHS repeat-associated protein